MKKLLALVLCVVMLASFSVNAFAADPKPTDEKGANVDPVTAKAVNAAIKAAYDATKAAYQDLAAEGEVVAVGMSFVNMTKSIADDLKKTLIDSKAATEADFAAGGKFEKFVVDKLRENLDKAIGEKYNELSAGATTKVAKADAYMKAVASVMSNPSNLSTGYDLLAVIRDAYLIAAEKQINKDYAAAVAAYDKSATEVYEKTAAEIIAAIDPYVPHIIENVLQ